MWIQNGKFPEPNTWDLKLQETRRFYSGYIRIFVVLNGNNKKYTEVIPTKMQTKTEFKPFKKVVGMKYTRHDMLYLDKTLTTTTQNMSLFSAANEDQKQTRVGLRVHSQWALASASRLA